MTLVERFLKYVSFDTQSKEDAGVTPSTPGQMTFARYLKEELESLGLEDVSLDDNGYLFATLPANTDREVPTIGFIAHMDTSPDMSGTGATSCCATAQSASSFPPPVSPSCSTTEAKTSS